MNALRKICYFGLSISPTRSQPESRRWLEFESRTPVRGSREAMRRPTNLGTVFSTAKAKERPASSWW